MYNHGPSTLQGPITQTRAWWAEEDSLPLAGTATTMENVSKDAEASDQPIRWDLVERVRREIAQGTYDTPEKWEAALDRLWHRLKEES
jgi:hypothetical protein